MQVITGHGCFRAYTHKIGKSERTNCDFCEAIIDDNTHTLIECKEWTEDRNVLTGVLGCPIRSLKIVLQEITRSKEKWKAFTEFCGRVMRSKEEKERERQITERRERLIEETAVLVGRRYGDNMNTARDEVIQQSRV